MGFGLYDAAFGALGRIHGDAARRSITGITLIAGFASTVGWPLTALGLESIGWRNTCFAWALAHILIGLPLNFFMLPAVAGAKAAVAASTKPHIVIDRTMILRAFAFAAAWSVTGAMAAHLPRILEAAGATTLQAVSAGALIGRRRYLPALSRRVFEPLPSAVDTGHRRTDRRHRRAGARRERVRDFSRAGNASDHCAATLPGDLRPAKAIGRHHRRGRMAQAAPRRSLDRAWQPCPDRLLCA
jgi:hypothetical protein